MQKSLHTRRGKKEEIKLLKILLTCCVIKSHRDLTYRGNFEASNNNDNFPARARMTQNLFS